MIKSLILAGLAVAGLSSWCFAQQKVDFGGDGTEPKLPEVHNNAGGELYVMVSVPGSPLLLDALDSAPRASLTPQFRDVFQAFREDHSKQFYLVRTKNEPYVWGWLRKTGLLMDVEAKRLDNKTNPTFIKAVLKNNLQVSMSEQVSLLAGPGSKEALEKNGLAQILYVFDEKKGPDGADYLLLGWDAEWNPDRPTDSIRGWARKDECTIWDSRIAAYYNRKNIGKRPLVNIYRSLPDLQAGKPPLATESPNSDKILTYDKARFPVLQYGDTESKIAFIGDPSRNLKISLDKTHTAMEAARNMQILFIIDATTSMGKYFPEVQRAVKEYIQSISNDQEKARQHFAVAVYRDYQDGPNGEMEIISDFDDPRGLDKLGSVKAYSSPDDHDLEEAVFNGIVRSTGKVKWDKGMLKEIVVIGDDPNHPTDPRGLTVSSVVKALQTQMAGGLQSGFRFNAINLTDQQHRRLNDEFVSEMRQIGNQFKPAGRFEQIPGDSGDIFRHSVVEVLHNMLDTSEKVSEVISKMQSGASANEVAPRYGTELTGLAISLLEEVGVRPDVISQAGITQVSQEGWVRMVANQQPQMEPWVYIERREMDEFRGFLASLLRSAEQKQRASQIVKDAVMRASGDPLLSGETVADYVKRQFSLPFKGDSMILSKTPDQLQQALGEQAFWTQFRKRIGYSYEVLGLVSEERDPSALKWDDVQAKWVRNPQIGEAKAWVTSAGGEKFCWIPLDFLP